MTPSLPLPPDMAVPADELEQADLALRQRLGLRPTVYPEAGRHPDQRPCPPWCSVGLSQGEREHEIVALHPMEAMHHIDTAIRTAASRYPGEPGRGIGAGDIRTATVESDLTRLGSADPVISVYLRHWELRRQRYRKRLDLTLRDAAELASALRFLVDLAAELAPQS